MSRDTHCATCHELIFLKLYLGNYIYLYLLYLKYSYIYLYSILFKFDAMQWRRLQQNRRYI